MAKKTKTTSGTPLGCSLLLLPFASVGVFMMGLICWTLIQWAQMSQWEEGSAIILEMKVRHGDSSDSTGVDARYSYEWEGQLHENDWVSLYGATDNIGSFQKQMAKELHSAHKKKETVPCYINPRNPKQAILYRDLRWEMIAVYTTFAEAFGGIGIGGILLIVMFREEIKDEDKLKAQYPDEPWKWKRDWLEGILSTSGGSSFPGGIIFAAGYWNIVALPMWILAPLQVIQGNYFGLIGFIFPLIGVLLVIWAVRVKIRLNKYGVSSFRLLENPISIGGRLEGALFIDKPLYPDNGFEFKLQCKESISQGDSSNTEILYEDSQSIDYTTAVDIDGHMAVPMFFTIPYECKGTKTEGSRTVSWELNVHAKVPGVDYAEAFDLPVFKTEKSATNIQERASTSTMENLIDHDAPLKKARIRLEQDGFGQLTIQVPSGRNLAAALGLGIFGIISLVLMFSFVMPRDQRIGSVSAIFCSLCLYGALNILLQASEIEVNEGMLIYRRGWFFLRRTQSIPLQEITGFGFKKCMSSGQKAYYHIYAERGSRKTVLIRYVLGQAACRRLIAILEEWMIR